MKISVDFDNTLSRKSVQNYIKELISKGVDVWVTTARFDSENIKIHKLRHDNSDLWEIIDNLGIDKNKVHFTNMSLKCEHLFGKGFVFHLDDDSLELLYINENISSRNDLIGINVTNENYEILCNKKLNI